MRRAPLMWVLAGVVWGCRSESVPVPAVSEEARLPVTGDAYVTASLADATFLNPLLATETGSSAVNNLVYNGLVKYDRDLHLVGDLAESWEVLKGGREIVFRLRENVRWHDGKPLTAEDVKFTFERLRDPLVRTPFGSDYEAVKTFEVISPHRFRVVYREPFAPALESWGIGIVPKHVYEKGDFNTHPANRRPVGTGPFKFLRWDSDEKIVLTANLDSFEGRPGFDRVVFRVIPDSAVQFLELRQENIDSMGLTPDQYMAYPEFFRSYQKFRYPSFSYTFLAFNLDNPLFREKRVRRALAMALDKNQIIQGVLLGFGRSATGPFPPLSWAFNSEVPETPFDPAAAKDLLAEAGWKDSDGDGVLDKDGRPFEFTVITNQGNKLRELCAVLLQSHLEKVGVKVHVRILEWSTFIHQYVDKRQFEALIMGWNLSRDPDQYVIWHSSQREGPKYNFCGYQNAEADRLWEEGRREFDQAKRTLIYQRLHAILAEDLPYIFLYYPESLPVEHARFVGPEVAPAGLGWNFREWYTPQALQKYQYTP